MIPIRNWKKKSVAFYMWIASTIIVYSIATLFLETGFGFAVLAFIMFVPYFAGFFIIDFCIKNEKN